MRIGLFKNIFSRVLVAFFVVLALSGPAMAVPTGGSEFTAIETNTPDIEWSKIIGGSGAETGSDIVPTPDGGYILLATTGSDDDDIGANFGGFDLYVEKMSADGTREWKTVLGGSDYDAGSSITPTEDGGYILLADTLSDTTLYWTGTAGSGDLKMTNHGNWDMLVVKLLPDGRPSWVKTFGGSLGESDEYHASAIRELHDGNFVIAGSTNSADWPLQLPSPKSNFTSLGVIFTITPTGDMIWSRTLGFVPEGTQALTFFGDVAEREDGSLVAAGFTGSPDMIPVDHVSSDPYRGTDGLVAQYAADGTPMKWPVSSHGENYLTFGGVDHDEFAAIEQTDDDGFILAGTSKSDSSGQGDVWVVRLNKDGKAEWDKKFGGSDWDIGTSVQQVPGAFLVSGATYSHDGDVTSNPARESFWLLRITGADGALQWQQTFAGPGDESYCADAWPTADAGYIMLGSTSNRDGQPVNDSDTGGQKAWIVKLTTNLRKEIVKTPLSPAGADTTGMADPGQVIPHGGRVLHYSPSPVGRPNTTIVYAPAGDNQYRAEFYAEDPEATRYIVFPTGATYPATIIHYIPSGSTVTSLRDYQADVLDPGTGSVTFNLTEGRWYDESASAPNRSLPRGMCIAGAGCSVGNSAKQHLFLSSPLSPSGNAIPVFSVSRIADNQWIGTMGTFGSADPAESMIVEKEIPNPGQQINFTVLGDPETGSGLNLYVTEQAGLMSGNAVLQYSGVATSSVPLPSMAVTPRIWKHAASGDVLVYTGAPRVCTNVPECRLSGTFVPLWDIPNVTATYFANITTIYTMPPQILAANPGVPGKLAMVHNSPDDEPVPEVVVTGPLVPQKAGAGSHSTDEGYAIPWNATVGHAMKDGTAVTAIYDPNGLPLEWVEDNKATKIPVPGNRELPATLVFIVPSEAIVNQFSQQDIVVTDSTSRDPVISIKQEGAQTRANLPVSSGVYYIGKGGSVTSTAENNVFMTSPIGDSSENSRLTEPSFKHMREDFGNGQGIEILCNGLNENLECTGIVGKNLETGSDLSQPDILNFSVISAASPGDPDEVDFSAESVAYNEGNILHYTIAGKSSQTLSRIEVTPLIFTSQTGGPNLSFKGTPVVCLNSDMCTVSGTFEMNKSGTYYAHGYLDFVSPVSMTILGSPEHFYLTPDSSFIYYSNNPPGNLPGDSTIHQIDGKDIYIWGYEAGNQNLNSTDLSSINFIVYKVGGSNFADRIRQNVNGWGTALGWTGYGYAGKSRDAMSWKETASIFPPNAQQVQTGGYFQERYHAEILDGELSSSLDNKPWAFGECHHEHWDCPNWPDIRSCNHWILPNGYDDGREKLVLDFSAAGLISTTKSEVQLSNQAGGSTDGKAYILTSAW